MALLGAAAWAHTPAKPTGSGNVGAPAGAGAAPGAALASKMLDPKVVNDGHLWAERWIDPSGQATVADVMRLDPKAWQPSRSGDMLPLERPAQAWFRLSLPQGQEDEYWFLSVPVPGINSVHFYAPGPNGQLQQFRSGDQLATRDWNLIERYPTFSMPWTHDHASVVYLAVSRDIKSTVPIAITEGSVERQNHRNANVLLGLYFGVVAGCLLVALMRATAVREVGFGLYAVYALMHALTQASLTGIGGVYLWPHSGALANGVSLMLPILLIATGLVVVWELSAFRDVSAKLGLMLLSMAGLGLLAAAATPWLPFRGAFNLAVTYTAACAFVPLPVFAYAALRGNRYGWWGLLAFLPALLGATFPILRNLELIASGFWTQYALTIGSGLHLPLLLIVLEERRRDRNRANSRGRQADTSDPLTGTATRGLLLERIETCARRCARFRHDAALLVVDTLNFRDLVVEHGIEWHDRLLIDMAARIASVARDVDTVARIDNARFAVLLEGPMTRAKANAVAGRLVAVGTQYSRRVPEGVTLEFGVSIGMVTPLRLPAVNWLNHVLEAAQRLEADPGRRIAFAQGVPLKPMPTVGEDQPATTALP